MRNPSRREAIGALSGAGAAALVDPRSFIEQSIDPACGHASWGELAGTLPLSRPDGVVQRIEKRRAATGLDYRVVGIVWGGEKPIDRLAIRLGADGASTSFAVCPAPKTHRIWSIWKYRWKPPAIRTYDIALKVPGASVPQRRLDSGFYVRHARVHEV